MTAILATAAIALVWLAAMWPLMRWLGGRLALASVPPAPRKRMVAAGKLGPAQVPTVNVYRVSGGTYEYRTTVQDSGLPVWMTETQEVA